MTLGTCLAGLGASGAQIGQAYSTQAWGAMLAPLLLAYMLLYMPTLVLANGVAFRHLPDVARRFPRIRVWGTIGWIVAGVAISVVFGWDTPAAVARGALRGTFLMAAIASVGLAAYSLTLPVTPPQRQAGTNPLQALAMLRDRDFLAFLFASILICVPLAFY